MSLTDVVNTNRKLDSLVEATTETTTRTEKIHMNKKFPADFAPKLYETWSNYKKKFEGLLASVEHEVKITELRGKIGTAQEQDDDAEERITGQKEKLAKYKKEKEDLEDDIEEAEKEVKEKKEELEEVEDKITDAKKCQTTQQALLKKLNKELAVIEQEGPAEKQKLESVGTDVMRLIARREKQPKVDLVDGLAVDFFHMKKHNLDGATLDKFNFEKEEPNHSALLKMPKTHFALTSNAQITKWSWESFQIDPTKFDGTNALLKLRGTLIAPVDGEFTFSLNSDDGSFLYLGKRALETSKAFIKNGGLHGMVTKTNKVTLKKDQPLQYTVTWYGNNGGNGIIFKILDPKGKEVPLQIAGKPGTMELTDTTWNQDYCDGKKNFWNYSKWNVYKHMDKSNDKACEKACLEDANCETFLINPRDMRCHIANFKFKDPKQKAVASVACKGMPGTQYYGKIKLSAQKVAYDRAQGLAGKGLKVMPGQW